MNELAVGSVGAIIAILSTHGLKWFRAWQRARIETRRQLASEKDDEREDQIKMACRAIDASEKARATIETMLLSMHADLKECREEGKNLAAKIVQLEDDNRTLRREVRDVRLENDALRRHVEHLQDTLIKDYARKKESLIPAGDVGDVIQLHERKDR